MNEKVTQPINLHANVIDYCFNPKLELQSPMELLEGREDGAAPTTPLCQNALSVGLHETQTALGRMAK